MRLSDWAASLTELESAQSLFESLQRPCEWQSIATEARPLLVACSYLKNPRTILIVTSNYDRCLAWEAKLRLAGIPESDIYQLPSGSSSLFEDATPEYAALSDRIGALNALAADSPCIVIGACSAVLERTIPKEDLLNSFIQLRPGMNLDLVAFTETLVNMGYEPAEPVRLPGQFSRRGGILDVYVSGYDLPVRIELFDDEIESLRTFDPVNQRSLGSLNAVQISPSRETLYTGDPTDLTNLIRHSLDRESAALGGELGMRLEETVASDLDSISQRRFFDRLDLYRPYLFPDSGCAIDLLEDTDLLVLDEPLELEAKAFRAQEELSETLKARHERGEILESHVGDFIFSPEHLGSHELTVSMSLMNALPDWLNLPDRIDIGAASLEPYRGRSDALHSTIRNWIDADFTIYCATDQPNRTSNVLEHMGLKVGEDGIKILHGNSGGGFVVPDWRVALLSDAELFGVARLRLPQKRFSEGAPIATLLDLKPGDFVVHINFGIGVFRGLVKKTIEGVEKEFLFIEYAAPDKLFVPAEQLDRIQKYLNPGDSNPKLNRLTGNEWQKTLSKANEEAKKFARDLVKLYAERRSAQRRPFGPDTPWQQELETTFPWVETPSQLAAIQATKADLMQPYPMDRLVCGDVGFGKTEVAIRAAFKVVQNQKQVAVLCPTTILSEQHFRNFSERLGSFGVRLGLLNRFRSTKERTQILKDLADGKIDVVLGTHALLNKDIQFHDLGLVIVDEEHKFGVKQKESLKALRTSVDVLTMSATPIPRTLSMALMDIRQMSLITDPPPGRLPIRTFVRPYSREVVAEALHRELARGGQAFYVYNRVEGIYHVAEMLQKMVPHARIGIGHGQMTEAELEPVMIGFIRGEIDILLSTTIIENGIDIPNANTLIVENADKLGLSQLYQLRGRVGRSDRQAYSYFLYQSHKDLTDISMQRLQSLQEFSSLGSGYSLAFRDLQIRGAGELLGAKQHGAMASVGYELYTQLIEDAVQALKNGVDGKTPDEMVDEALSSREPLPSFEISLNALIPTGYIEEQAQRLYYYQQIMSARAVESLQEIAMEVEDRYGHPPEEVKNVFEVMRARMRMRDLGIEKGEAKEGRVLVQFRDRTKIQPRVFSIMGQRYRQCYLTRDSLVWPYQGNPLAATIRLLDTFEAASNQVREELAAIHGV